MERNESAIGTETMVVSPHALASAAGARILERGGNAFDAAVAVSACLAVVYPHMTGLGGDSFWLTYEAGESLVRGYNGSGRAGAAAMLETFADCAAIPTRGVRSAVTVPGMADAWAAVHGAYGRLGFAEVLEPAIKYAEGGFPLSADQYANSRAHADMLAAAPETAAIYLSRGEAPAAGSRFKQRQLARTLRELAARGQDAFYRGSIAVEIAGFLRDRGGLLTTEDFANHSGDWINPLVGTYRGTEIVQMPPNSQGFVGLMALNILENFDLRGLGHGTSGYYHLLVEALKLSFRDRNEVLTDPAFHDIPLERLLSKDYAAALAATIQAERAFEVNAEPMGSDTAFAAVVDKDGNAVSFIQSLYFEFGSGVVAGDTGILLQNRGSFFSLDPAHINCLHPGKRTFHTLMPAMALRDGKPFLLYGTQGGEGQPQTQTALVTRMLDYGMDPQRAVSEPRWVWGRTWGEPTRELKLESRIDSAVAAALAASGHLVRIVGAFDGIMGHAHAIKIDDDGFRQGGADPRSDGAAIGW
ncbi:gamma-glutamyltransferase [Paenibacillus rhizovicinus]|uniref:Glutathione hydrolase proenzyme n=1 Tax=Paenibacillus rhizovicinus TaxID=2704463 RepID=A0A6C0NTF7_9BACL|nr:gamma-glutamyltransferase [Paenibacillus rhizovicinus]QHW29484.1 gamma-glutamyltransferase [Paenibacillus rhizovicinus]